MMLTQVTIELGFLIALIILSVLFLVCVIFVFSVIFGVIISAKVYEIKDAEEKLKKVENENEKN